MMGKDDYQHFVCIVAGDNPSELMSEYDKNKTVKPYLVYKYDDAKKIKESFIKVYENSLKNELNPSQINYVKMTIQDLSEMEDDDFYYELVEDNGYTIDEKTGDAYSNKNKDGKWSSYTIGKIFSIPFLTKDGKEVFQAKNKDIDWEHIHLNGGEIYARAWEMVVDGDSPQNEYEEKIYENMKDKGHYFEKFVTKENYVISNTAFWGYAFLSDKTGWIDAADSPDQFMWMSTFYDMFIKNLDEDTMLTIYECRK